MSETILVDGNHMGYSQHSGTRLSVGDMQVQAIFGMSKAMRALRQYNMDADIMVLWDGKAQWRYDMLPIYKSDRDKDPKQAAMRENYRKQRPYIMRSLQLMGFNQLKVESHEADDMAGYFVGKLSRVPCNRVRLITGDEDWIQMVGENVSWFDPVKDKLVTHLNMMSETGYANGAAFLDGKALQGDTSDKIPPTGGIGKKGAPIFLAEFGRVEKFLAGVDSGKIVLPAKGKKAQVDLASEKGREAFRLNIKLMDLLNVPKPKPEDVKVIRGAFDAEKFTDFCARLAFHSLLRDFDNFTRPLKGKTL